MKLVVEDPCLDIAFSPTKLDYMNHTRPRLLFFKGARQEEIDAFEEQVNEFTIKMKYLLTCVDKLTGRT